MKKIFFALVALCTMTFFFTSCEREADPTKYPVSGKTFVFENDSLYTTLEFNENFTAELETKKYGEPLFPQPYTWSMKGNTVQLRLFVDMKYGAPINKTLPKGTLIFEGPYDAEKRTLYLKSQIIEGDNILMHEKGSVVY